jgi:hypothetical protein
MSKRVKVGDIVAIPLNDICFGYAQLIDGNKLMGCYILFDIFSENHPCIDDIVTKPILYMIFTSAYKIQNNEWKVIGNRNKDTNIKIPLFKVDLLRNGETIVMVSDFKGNILRKATEDEKVSLCTMSSYTAVVVEKILKAKYGIAPWEEYFSSLIYKG